LLIHFYLYTPSLRVAAKYAGRTIEVGGPVTDTVRTVLLLRTKQQPEEQSFDQT